MKQSITRSSFVSSLNKEQQCACAYACVFGKVVVQKSTEQLHFASFFLRPIHTTLDKLPSEITSLYKKVFVV